MKEKLETTSETSWELVWNQLETSWTDSSCQFLYASVSIVWLKLLPVEDGTVANIASRDAASVLVAEHELSRLSDVAADVVVMLTCHLSVQEVDVELIATKKSVNGHSSSILCERPGPSCKAGVGIHSNPPLREPTEGRNSATLKLDQLQNLVVEPVGRELVRV